MNQNELEQSAKKAVILPSEIIRLVKKEKEVITNQKFNFYERKKSQTSKRTNKV